MLPRPHTHTHRVPYSYAPPSSSSSSSSPNTHAFSFLWFFWHPSKNSSSSFLKVTSRKTLKNRPTEESLGYRYCAGERSLLTKVIFSLLLLLLLLLEEHKLKLVAEDQRAKKDPKKKGKKNTHTTFKTSRHHHRLRAFTAPRPQKERRETKMIVASSRCAAIKAPIVNKNGARSSSRMVVVPRVAKSFSASSASASTSKSSTACTFLRHRGGGRQHNHNAIAVPEPEINDEIVGTTTTMEYNETGKWREGFDLAGWAKEIREVRTKKRLFFLFLLRRLCPGLD